MGLPWPSISTGMINPKDEFPKQMRRTLDRFADRTRELLAAAGLPNYSSPLWRPWNLYVIRDPEKAICVFTPLAGGTAQISWDGKAPSVVTPQQAGAAIAQQLGQKAAAIIPLPLPDSPKEDRLIEDAARSHLEQVERETRLGRLGDISHVSHLEPHLRSFLGDHPDTEMNVFLIMRFLPSAQLQAIHLAIKEALEPRGFHVVRADDRDYTGELWSNVEVYLTGCKYGIAVFEDIDVRDFNPNVALELGYMLGRGKRCLILKEQRLPDLPADVIHRLYKPFDVFNIESSVSREVIRWVEVDLGIRAPRT